jgi:MFS family permease
MGPERTGASRRRLALAALCVTEFTCWGGLYYSLPVATASITATEGWSAATVTGAFSAGLLLSAVVGVLVGRWLDRAGPRVVMTAGSVLGAVGLVLVAVAHSVAAFLVAWLVVGVAQAAVLYQPAFTAIARWYGDERTRPLTILTLVAGFASTLFAPLITASIAASGWRTTYFLLAAAVAAVTIPAHALLLTPPWTKPPRHGGFGPRSRASSAIGGRRFHLLQLGMTLIALGLYAVTLNLIPLLTSRGVSTATAATAFGLVGAGQVVGRLAFAALPARSVPSRTTAVGVTATAALALLAVLPGPTIALLAAAVLAGAGRGAYTLVQATAVADRWGTEHLGTVHGAFVAPITAATAIAPAIGVLVATELDSYPAAAATFAVAVAAGALLLRRR